MIELDPCTRRRFLARALATGAVPLLPRPAGGAPTAAAVDVGSRLELMVDDHLVERAGGVERRLHHPVPRDVALVHDAPWEGTGSGYHSVFRDGGRYRMYYRGSDLKPTGTFPASVACYAESDDGLRWRKPELGLVEHGGSKRNNIVLKSGPLERASLPVDAGHVAFFRDENEGAPPEARYKALVGVRGESALLAFHSADGLRWQPLRPEPVMSGGQFDSQNVAFWDPVHKLYRAYCRFNERGVRRIRTATSEDFIQWSAFQPVEFPGADPSEHIYTNAVKPYPRAPHLLVGFPVRYVERGWSDSMRALPELELREARAKGQLRYGTALTEALLMTSRDGRTFNRFDEAFLRPGPERPGTWHYGQQYVAWQAVETRSALHPDLSELSLYATERYWHGPGTVLRRYTLRLDGFASMRASAKGGEFVTKPLTFAGDRLALNVSTAAAGSVRVEVQDAAGRPIPEFALSQSGELFGDAHARRVTWHGNPGLAALAGKPVRLRFVLKDADVYAFQFAG